MDTKKLFFLVNKALLVALACCLSIGQSKGDFPSFLITVEVDSVDEPFVGTDSTLRDTIGGVLPYDIALVNSDGSNQNHGLCQANDLTFGLIDISPSSAYTASIDSGAFGLDVTGDFGVEIFAGSFVGFANGKITDTSPNFSSTSGQGISGDALPNTWDFGDLDADSVSESQLVLSATGGAVATGQFRSVEATPKSSSIGIGLLTGMTSLMAVGCVFGMKAANG